MDVASKIVSIFLNLRLQILLESRGTPYQFGATPKLGCQDATFVLKSFLQDRREKGYDTWVVFADLVKACDSVQHEVIRVALEIFGVPSELIGWVMKLCTDFEVEVKVGKHKARFPHGCGVKQGDSLAPILFILVMQLAAESLAVEFRNHGINLPDVRVSISNECVIRKHKPNQIATMDHLALLILLYMDDGALPFCSRKDAIIGSQICIEVMAKFGLIVHTGKIGKESKTKAMFFPGTKTLKRWRVNKSSAPCITDTSPPGSCDTVASVDCDKVDLHKLHVDAPETQVLDIDTDEHVPFVSSFCYLGS